MKAFTILSALMFAAFAVAMPANNEADKAEVWKKKKKAVITISD